MSLFANKSFLGIDIGAYSIKIVELKKENNKARLVSYGFSEREKIETKDNLQSGIGHSAKLINKILNEAGMKSREAIAALPTFSVFSSILNLSYVDNKDLAAAVHWEAKKVIPLPLDDMVLDWKKIEDGEGNKNNNIKILLTGAPRNFVKKYIDIFKEAKVNLLSLETETFSLIRSLLGNDKSSVMIVEMGANTTDISIIDKSIPIFSRSIDVGGMTITKGISNSLNIGQARAEQFKYDLGISSMASREDIIPKTVIETISPIINEVKYTINLFQSKDEKKIEKVILSGGSALLINFTNYLSKILDKQVIIGNPWARVSYPVELEPLLYEIGPRMSAAIGLAMRSIE